MPDSKQHMQSQKSPATPKSCIILLAYYIFLAPLIALKGHTFVSGDRVKM